MNEKLNIDDGEFPNSGTEHDLLMWITRFAIEDESAPEQLIVLILDGPGEWSEDLEVLEPRYPGLPDAIPMGLYVVRVRLEYDFDKVGDIYNTRLCVLAYRRVPTPSRRDLRMGTAFDDRGMRA